MLQDLEEEFLKRYEKSIAFYGCYVNDSFIIIARNKLKLLLRFLNSYHPRLQFTHEIGKDNSLSFLDVLVKKNPDTSISVDLYKKSIASERYINYLSSHSLQTKIGIVKNLIHKIYSLSDQKFHVKNIKIIKQALTLNNYPLKFIEKHTKNYRFS